MYFGAILTQFETGFPHIEGFSDDFSSKNVRFNSKSSIFFKNTLYDPDAHTISPEGEMLRVSYLVIGYP